MRALRGSSWPVALTVGGPRWSAVRQTILPWMRDPAMKHSKVIDHRTTQRRVAWLAIVSLVVCGCSNGTGDDPSEKTENPATPSADGNPVFDLLARSSRPTIPAICSARTRTSSLGSDTWPRAEACTSEHARDGLRAGCDLVDAQAALASRTRHHVFGKDVLHQERPRMS